MAAAHEHRVPHSEFLGWDQDDRDAYFASLTYQGESCSACGVHPSHWKRELGGHPHAVVPTWTFCRVCELIEQAKTAGPPTDSGGWHLTLKFNPRPG